MALNDHELLADFIRNQSQDAFTQLVNRHLNLVYSAALRQVRLPQLAEEVSQSVFLNLARNAGRLSKSAPLAPWLYQVTRNAAIDVIRREAGRQAREQIACQMLELNDSSTAWPEIEPLIDEAMDSLDPADRTALLMRFFENKSLREVGDAIDASEDAAQKRVSRALDRLREHFSKRKISIGTGVLTSIISAHAVQAAPTGLSLTIASTASAGLAAISSATAVSNTIALSMTATQKILVSLALASAVAFGVYEATKVGTLRAEVLTLRQAHDQNADLAARLQLAEKDRDSARAQVAELAAATSKKTNEPNEALKLRGEVSRLRNEKTALGSTSGLSKITANPESRKIMRDQQKMGMSMLYKSFGADMKFSKEQSEKLDDLLADHIMDNIDNVTLALRDKLTLEQMRQLFGSQDAALDVKLRELLGEEAFGKYEEYSQNLISALSAQQFKNFLEGDDAAKKEKTKQIEQILRQESRAFISETGLPTDYQFIPILNFENIASEAQGEQSLQRIEQLYDRAAKRLDTILNEKELAKLQEFRAKAIENNRGALKMNRSLMAPIGE